MTFDSSALRPDLIIQDFPSVVTLDLLPSNIALAGRIRYQRLSFSFPPF